MRKSAVFFLLMLLLAAVTAPASAAASHTHTGVLEALRTEAGLEIPCCGVFRCTSCGETYEATVTPADTGLPIVRLEGSLEGISKENKVTVQATYDDGGDVAFTSAATLKWQGASSVGYPKKNYTIQFIRKNGAKNKLTLRTAWGEQSKYCLKANWVDCSAARNLVSAKLWGEIVHSECKDDPLDPLVNGGAVDGFPVLLYHNGDFQGLYTLNTPKDEWIFGMDGKTKREGVLFSENWTNSTFMEIPVYDFDNPAASGWRVEYCATEENPKEGYAWLLEGINGLIVFLKENTGDALREGLGDYTDVDRAIDYMLYTLFLCGRDNLGKNTLWVTYDGVKYLPSVYDLDSTWGLYYFDCTFPDLIPEWSTFEILREDLLFSRLLDDFNKEVKARYAALREDVLSYRNIERQFTSFISQIPAFVYAADAERWPDAPSRDENNLSQILRFAADRIKSLDTLFGVTVTEKTQSAWRAAFACEGGVKAYVYPDGDLTAAPLRAASAWSVNADTGALTQADGQISFYADVPKNKDAAVEITPAGNFGQLLGPDETGEKNTYRVTGITGDITVRVLPNEKGAAVPTRPDAPQSLRAAVWLILAGALAVACLIAVSVFRNKRRKNNK